jgi:tripartite-type tricarboxylate transporter receptor subunit TctC
MEICRRRWLALTAGIGALPVASRLSVALDYPTRPVRILVGFGAGSGLDVYARLIAQWLSPLGRAENIMR